MAASFAVLLRHGAYDQKPGALSALQPWPLTQTGIAQARDAGREIAGLARAEGWRLAPTMFCSRQQRAWQTATLAAHTLGEETGTDFAVLEDSALAERSVGAFANLTLAEIEQILADDPRMIPPPKNWKSDSHYRLPADGAESLMEAGARVAGFLRQQIADAPEGADAVVFVGHGASFRHAAHHLGVLGLDDIGRLSMHHARPVVLKAGTDGAWSQHAGTWKERRPPDTETD